MNKTQNTKKGNTMDATLRKKAGRKPFTIPENIRVDWTLPNGVIAQKIGTTTLTVMKLRARLGIAPLPRGRPLPEDKLVCNEEVTQLDFSDNTLTKIQDTIDSIINLLK